MKHILVSRSGGFVGQPSSVTNFIVSDAQKNEHDVIERSNRATTCVQTKNYANEDPQKSSILLSNPPK